MAEIEILGGPQSNYVQTVRIVLEEKRLPYAHIPAAPHSPEVKAINPYGQIPVMRHGKFALFESRAIIAYLHRLQPRPALLPDDPEPAAITEQWVSAFCTSIRPAVLPYLREYAFPPSGKTDRAIVEERIPIVRRQIELLDRAVASGALSPGEFTLADAYLMPILNYLSMGPESGEMIRNTKALSAYLNAHAKRPSFVKTTPPFDMSALQRQPAGQASQRASKGP